MAGEATAGFRNASWTMDGLPADAMVTVHPLQTQDGAAVNGFRRRLLAIKHTPDLRPNFIGVVHSQGAFR